MQIHSKLSGVTGLKFTVFIKFVAMVISPLAVLMQQCTLRSVHSLSIERGDIKTKLQAKQERAGIAVPGGLISDVSYSLRFL